MPASYVCWSSVLHGCSSKLAHENESCGGRYENVNIIIGKRYTPICLGFTVFCPLLTAPHVFKAQDPAQDINLLQLIQNCNRSVVCYTWILHLTHKLRDVNPCLDTTVLLYHRNGLVGFIGLVLVLAFNR